jgi:hypothetical protein
VIERSLSSPRPSRELIQLLGQALIDPELRGRLFASPEATALQFNLSAEEIEAIRRLDRHMLEQISARLRWG